MNGEAKCLRILKEGVSLNDIFKEEFLIKLNENLEDNEVIPIGAAFILKNDDVTEDMFNLTYRNDDDLEDNIVLIDVKNNPSNMDIIQKLL